MLIVTDEVEQIEITDPTPQVLESIHPGVSSLLEKIGLGGAEVKATQALYSGIHAGDSYAPLGEDSSGIWKGLHINRQIFNAQLLDRVVDSGVSVLYDEKVDNFISQNDRVTGVSIGTKELHAKYIIDASGKKAIAGKKLNFRRRFFSPPLICWTGISEYQGTFPFDEHTAHFIPGKKGWTWLAPQPPHYCAWTRLSLAGEKLLLQPDELKDFATVGKIHFANMRWRMYRPVCREGVILCGDAAGILDPAAGQGIFNALWSGVQAANTVVACLHQTNAEAFHLAAYDNWFVGQFEEKATRLKAYYMEHGITLVDGE